MEDGKGMRFGRYLTVRTLGKGAQGQVYEAMLQGPGGFRKRVALKVMAHGDGLKREARLGGLLCHPNLVDVFEVGSHEGVWFSAMEYCAGGTLAALSGLSQRAIVEVGLQVCDALSYAHEALGLVHLDLKPANLLLEGGRLKVADLGIARAEGFEEDARIRGTRGYMSPEQLRGEALDARADVYALGVVLLKLAGGVTPWDQETLPVSWPEEASSTEPELDAPVWLRPVLQRALMPQAADRFPSMQAFADALRTLSVSGSPLSAFSTARAEPSWGSTPLTAFVGRESEVRRVHTLLEEPGVVLVRGSGGVGKSRLATEVASTWAGRVWSCDLSNARTPMQALGVIAQAMGVPLTGKDLKGVVMQLSQVLEHAGAPLLLLHTPEHLPAAESWLGALAQRAPAARFLVTSRAPLEVARAALLLEPLQPASALELLQTRVRARGHSFEDDTALRSLATRLDGIPFALELAAARIGVLSPEEVLERLELGWLRNAQPDALPRERTVEETLRWSWALLDSPERDALILLSVFVGGFRAEAAEAVLSEGADEGADEGGGFVLDRLQTLTDHCWLYWRDGRFRWLETARSFAAEQGDVAAAQSRHRSYFAALGTPAALDRLDGFGARTVMRTLEAELENLVAACRRADRAGEVEQTLHTLAASLAVYFDLGPYQTGVDLIEDLALTGATPAQRACFQTLHGRVLGRCGHLDRARSLYEEAIRGHRRCGNTPLLAGTLYHLGALRLDSEMEGQLELAEALQLSEAHGFSVIEANVHGQKALGASLRGELQEALIHHRKARRLHIARGNLQRLAVLHSNLCVFHAGQRREVSYANALTALALHTANGTRRSVGVVLTNLSVMAETDGDLAQAIGLAERSLQIHRDVGNRRFEGLVLGNLGAIFVRKQQWAESIPNLRAAVAIHEENRSSRFCFMHRCGLALSLAKTGAVEEAESQCRLAEEEAAAHPMEIYRLQIARAVLADARGETENARQWVAKIEQTLTVMGLDRETPLWDDLEQLRVHLGV